MAKEIEKSILQELKRFSEINHNSDNLNEQKISVAGNAMADDIAADRQDCVDRNTQHLELMKAKDDWGSEDFTDADAAIVAGNGYTA